MVEAKQLVKYGFLNDKGRSQIADTSLESLKRFVDSYGGKFEELADMEIREAHTTFFGGKPGFTGYPKSVYSNRLIYENYSMSVEEMYFWILNQITVEAGYRKDEVIKITDVFSASEMSTYWGISAQRISIQQDRASQYLKFIADMVKSMFQLIRDLNIVDEKLGYYADSFSDDPKKSHDGDTVLKGQYADLVEGGPKSPSSIFGMAQQYNFVTLPNLFFQAKVPGKTEDEIIRNLPDYVEKLREEFGNDTLKTVLERKLSQYYRWKFRTFKQLNTYRKLYKSYLRQHYNNIRLYMNWVKPYLRNIKRLSPSAKKSDSAELVAAFEGEMIEIEILAQKKVGNYYSVIIANFDYRTVPQLEWVPGHQERRATMTGRAEMHLRAYSWTKDQWQNYVKMKEEEDLELLKEINETIKDAMETLGEDIKKYLSDKERPEDNVKKEKPKKWVMRRGKITEVVDEDVVKGKVKHDSVFSPFGSLFEGFGLLFKPFTFNFSWWRNDKGGKGDASKAADTASKAVWNLYKYYKKSHGLLAW